MLKTRERTLLLENLRPPPGYRVRRAIGTSYTLDLIALLTAPLAFTFFDVHDEDGAPMADPVALLEALRRHAENVTIFCQAGAIAVPRPDQKLLAYLEGSVVPVRAQNPAGIFHPKVWVLEFVADDGPTVYRVLCLSRNLTFDRAWDTCLQLEGRLTGRTRGYGRNAPLAEFLRALPGMATRPLSRAIGEDLDRICHEIRRVDFEAPAPFEDFRIHPMGLSRRRSWPFPDARRSLALSPYLVGSAVDRLRDHHGLDVLISRPEAFEDLLREGGATALPNRCFVLSPGANLDAREPDEPAEERPMDEDRPELTGLHAKLFLFENGVRANLFTGSANATSAAFGLNVELLVELVGRSRHCGIEALLGSNDETQSTLRSLLEEYRPPESLEDLEPVDKERRALERSAERLSHALGGVRLRAVATEAGEGGRWEVILSGRLPPVPAGVEVTVWPVTLAQTTARSVPLEGVSDGGRKARDPEIARFEGLSFEALTGFYAFELTVTDGARKAKRRFTVTAELEGAPEDRRARLLRSFLSDRRQVMRLLLLLLMDEGADVSMFVAGAQGDATEHGPPRGLDEPTLLEALLRSLSRNPDRIEHVARLIADLERTREGSELLPDGLAAIWEPVWAARQALSQ